MYRGKGRENKRNSIIKKEDKVRKNKIIESLRTIHIHMLFLFSLYHDTVPRHLFVALKDSNHL